MLPDVSLNNANTQGGSKRAIQERPTRLRGVIQTAGGWKLNNCWWTWAGRYCLVTTDAQSVRSGMLTLRRLHRQLSRFARPSSGAQCGLIKSKSADSCAGYLFIEASRGVFAASELHLKLMWLLQTGPHPTSCCRLALTPEKLLLQLRRPTALRTPKEKS